MEKNEDFDKKEIDFGRKMILFKKKSDLSSRNLSEGSSKYVRAVT